MLKVIKGYIKKSHYFFGSEKNHYLLCLKSLLNKLFVKLWQNIEYCK